MQQTLVSRAAAFPSTFYGQLAIKKNNQQFFIPDTNQNISKEEIKYFYEKPLIKALIILNQANHNKLFKSLLDK